MPASSERAVRFYSRQGRSAKTLVRVCPKTPERKNYESEDNTMRKSDFTLPMLDDLFSTQAERLKFKREELRKYFPSGYTEEQMRRDIIKGLELLKRQRERNRDAR
jgi:hypothetical protein